MSSADLFEDGYPHGTVEGFKGGCRGGSCPAGVEHGLSCKRANQLNSGDYRYPRLVREGLSPAAIAAALNGHTTPEETPDMPTPADVAKATKPLTVEPVPEISDDIVEEQPTPEPPAADAAEPVDELITENTTEGLTTRQKRAKLAEIRNWCRDNGFPGLGTRGTIPHAALAAYDAAHSNQVDVTTERDEEAPVIIPEEVAERVEAFIDEQLVALNAEADGEPDFDPDEIGAPTEPQVLRGAQRRPDEGEVVVPLEADTAAFDEAMEQARARADAPRPERPEWADVAISVDVERARDLACRLEQELAHVTEQLATAHAAVETTLQKWDSDRREMQAQIAQLTITAAIATGAANVWADLYQTANNEVARLRVKREMTFAGELERFLSTPEQPKRRVFWRNRGERR